MSQSRVAFWVTLKEANKAKETANILRQAGHRVTMMDVRFFEVVGAYTAFVSENAKVIRAYAKASIPQLKVDWKGRIEVDNNPKPFRRKTVKRKMPNGSPLEKRLEAEKLESKARRATMLAEKAAKKKVKE